MKIPFWPAETASSITQPILHSIHVNYNAMGKYIEIGHLQNLYHCVGPDRCSPRKCEFVQWQSVRCDQERCDWTKWWHLFLLWLANYLVLYWAVSANPVYFPRALELACILWRMGWVIEDAETEIWITYFCEQIWELKPTDERKNIIHAN
jgi:hypothetical protein